MMNSLLTMINTTPSTSARQVSSQFIAAPPRWNVVTVRLLISQSLKEKHVTFVRLQRLVETKEKTTLIIQHSSHTPLQHTHTTSFLLILKIYKIYTLYQILYEKSFKKAQSCAPHYANKGAQAQRFSSLC